MKLVLSAITAIVFAGTLAQANNELDILKGNNLDAQAQEEKLSLNSADSVQKQVAENMKLKCNRKLGCQLFVDTASGREFRVGANAGVGSGYGSNYGGNYGAGGDIIIGGIDRSNDLNYGAFINLTFGKSVCRHYVLDSVFQFVEMYVRKVSTPEYVDKVLTKAEAGEETPVPPYVSLAFATLATLKPGQGQCQALNNNGYGR